MRRGEHVGITRDHHPPQSIGRMKSILIGCTQITWRGVDEAQVLAEIAQASNDGTGDDGTGNDGAPAALRPDEKQ
jgi:hypothetical protein